jgi:hypothetical protein
MADTIRQLAALQAILPDNITGQISPQDLRDFLVSAVPTGRGPTLVVAASNASDKRKADADYLCDGTADEVEINAAIAAAVASGGKVQLSEGKFLTAATVTMDTGVWLDGMGEGATEIEAGAGVTVAVITVPKDNSWLRITNMQIDAEHVADVHGIYLEGDAAGLKVESAFLENLDIRDADASIACWGIYWQNPFKSVIRNVHIYNCANGLLCDMLQDAYSCGNSRIDNVYLKLTTDNGVGFQFGQSARSISHIFASRLQVNRAAAETGLTGLLVYGGHQLVFNEINFEGVAIGVQVDGSGIGADASQDVLIDGGYIQSASNTGKGIYITASALRTNIRALNIEGTPGATSIGIDDDCATAGHYSSYRDCYVKTFDTLRDIAQSATWDNIRGCLTILDPGNGNAISVATSGSVPLVSTGADTRTLAIPTFVGQQLMLVHKTDGGSCAVTVASDLLYTADSGHNIITFTAVAEFIKLEAVDNNGTLQWAVLALDGAVLSG